MTPNFNNNSTYDPSRQLELINLKCISLGPDIYKSLAFYLQLVRSILPIAIKDAIYQLIISNKNSIGTLTLGSKKDTFYERVDATLSNCLSLLTVENLNALAEKLDKDRQMESNDLVNSSNESSDKIGTNLSNELASNSISVDLSYSLPTDSQIDLKSWDSNSDNLNSLNFNFEDIVDQSKEIEEYDDEVIVEECGELNDSTTDSSTEKKDIDLLKSIFKLAGNISSPVSKELHDKDNSNSQDDDEIIYENINEIDSFLPQTPQDLCNWLLTIDEALLRRLRNLSHLINIELIRVGIINSFLPTNLLDAVLAGQIASINAPSNILKLRLPISSASNNEIDIECLLVRPSELEFDHIKLRQCRQKITQQRNVLLKLIRQQRYWQSQSLAKEVKEQWWRNSQANQMKSP